ncbi:BT0820 family HAD-type phosphatase [Bacteroides sedimenti]|uniref:Hydrolase n=1 Tax=Bacteroides sedimenti TaxID=2136147 RepID=A0ABM8I9V5_9BACE
MIIAVDFDGTIVEHEYPQIGKEIPFAIETLKKLQDDQHRLILWTVREGRLLDEAIEFCRERGLEFYAANKDFPEEHGRGKGYSRKLKADLFIDDRNLGGLPDWGVIYQMIKNGSYRCGGFDMPENAKGKARRKGKKKNIFLRIGEAIDGMNGDY